MSILFANISNLRGYTSASFFLSFSYFVVPAYMSPTRRLTNIQLGMEAHHNKTGSGGADDILVVTRWTIAQPHIYKRTKEGVDMTTTVGCSV